MSAVNDVPEREAVSTVGNAIESGPEPLTTPAVKAPAVLLGLVLCGVSALCIRELIIYHDLVGGDPWLADTSVWIAQLQWRNWMMFAAPGALLIGLLLIVAAVKPRRRTHLRLRAGTDVWLRPTDVARLCSAAAFEDTEVLTATTTVSGRRAAVTVTAPEDAFAEISGPVQQRVESRVTATLAELDHPLPVRVSVLPSVRQAADQRRRVI